MPAADVVVGVPLVRRLIADQFASLVGEPVRLLANGWDNFSFRVGSHLVARLPRREVSATLIDHEARWLPRLAPLLPLPVPAPIHLGRPGHGYPWNWVIAPWIDGSPVSGEVEPDAAADDLGAFLDALHQPAPHDAPSNPYRGIPLRDRDESTRSRIADLADRVDSERLLDLWEAALSSPAHQGPSIWLHGDLHPLNLLAEAGRLSGVIDFGDITSGDPATDLAVAWMIFDRPARSRFRSAYGKADDDTWERARGWAVSLATSYLAHSADSPPMADIGTATLQRLTAGDESGLESASEGPD
ncbi:MAG TPA: aminoglycoside phosphotransferase family protein [Acidimicrobiia bacterium]|nr:aminoglycoside phosphotransferase family protein [Acidimicrobiia bacterium]